MSETLKVLLDKLDSEAGQGSGKRFRRWVSGGRFYVCVEAWEGKHKRLYCAASFDADGPANSFAEDLAAANIEEVK